MAGDAGGCTSCRSLASAVVPEDHEVSVRTARLVIAYDGTDFHGLAESDGVPTVLGAVRAELAKVLRRDVELTAAGRTDAGVHAWGQVVSGQFPAGSDLDRVARSLNRLCGPAIAVRHAEWADRDFSARFSATGRTYRYRIWNAAAPHPMLARWTWHVEQPLDLGAMLRAARHLLGEHDFSSFCRRPRPRPGATAPSLVRRVERARWSSPELDLLQFEISATSFCHQMVRSIVGTLVDVGLGRRDPESIAATIEARDRDTAGRVAPPTGLVLWHVDYEGRRWDA